MTYLLIANFSLLLFYLLYILLLKGLTFFQWNRIYLLGTLFLSYMLPLLAYIDVDTQEDIYNTLPIVYTQTAGILVIEAGSSVFVDQVNWYWVIYGLGCLLSFLYLLLRIFNLRKLLKGQHPDAPKNYTLFHKVYVDLTASNAAVIHRHEQVHAQQGHSYDLFIVEILRIFNWFNPIIYRYYEALKFQHECIADQYAAIDKVSYAQMLVAQAMDTRPSLMINTFSTKHQLKNRIIMLFKKETKKVHVLKYVLIMPLFLGLSAIVVALNRPSTFSNTAPIENIVSKLEELGKESTARAVHAKQEVAAAQVDSLAAPQGGLSAFRNWIGENFNYKTVSNPKDSLIVVRFMLDKEGNLSDFQQVDARTSGGDELIRLLKVGPKWAPQIENGKATASTYIMPIRIKIPTPEKYHAKPENDSLNTIMEHPPLPVGGVDKFRNWLAANYVIPSEAVKAKVKGQLVATFVIDKEGKLTDIEITEDLGYGTGKAYKALLGHAAPWQAGIENGRPVRVKYTLPIQINVN